MYALQADNWRPGESSAIDCFLGKALRPACRVGGRHSEGATSSRSSFNPRPFPLFPILRLNSRRYTADDSYCDVRQNAGSLAGAQGADQEVWDGCHPGCSLRTTGTLSLNVEHLAYMCRVDRLLGSAMARRVEGVHQAQSGGQGVPSE